MPRCGVEGQNTINNSSKKEKFCNFFLSPIIKKKGEMWAGGEGESEAGDERSAWVWG